MSYSWLILSGAQVTNQIIWSDHFSVGYKELDDQHFKIISLINKLHESGFSLSPEEVDSGVLKEMVRYAKLHLSFEEILLKNVNILIMNHMFPITKITYLEFPNFLRN